ncbi:MAG: acyl-CoA thioesterase [Pelagibacterales bacterium]|nr:acyl-CoA thioesterase [Pelagibacterales bacterium]MBT3938926.1 acyl-CoA thioesterase [Pelagibacterales bacterium]MDG2267496.1 thioesterase family protein [Alphaproteobacteria bacterium]|tara:strand:+ start:278 stop:712 length:435 start_codon:yes stop_codon:yes gene_type:complete
MQNNKNIHQKLSIYKNIFEENVRWGDTDGYNHVNNVSISRYFESARVNIIRNLETEKYSFVIVNFNINYIGQIFYPSKIKIGTYISRIGNKSITFDQALFVNNKCKASAKSILAYADIKESKAYKISKSIILKLNKIYGANDET